MAGFHVFCKFELVLASGCNVYHPELIFASHILITVEDVKASGPPHICVMWLAVSKGHAASVVLSLGLSSC